MILYSPNEQPKSERRPHGTVIICGIDGEKQVDTLQCPHCGAHFMSVLGSGHRRSYCANCDAVTCGNLECDNCTHFMKKIESLELLQFKYERDMMMPIERLAFEHGIAPGFCEYVLPRLPDKGLTPEMIVLRDKVRQLLDDK